MSWSAYHAACQRVTANSTQDKKALLPLFKEEAHSPAMIKHAIDVIRKAVEFLNPGQTTVVAFDQPLFAIAKQIQWQWPDVYGEKRLIVMFGGLHIEMAALKALGKWLEDSGWTSSLVMADVASSGTADSFLKASHVSKTRRAHQITAASLSILMQKAYKDHEKNAPEEDILSFESWRIQREAESPQFQFWSITLSFELLILIFVRSMRERNFCLYKDALTSLMPWFFALDHPNYARWLSIHVRDMVALQENEPSVFEQFENGNFVVNKSGNRFSSIPIDHAHEQNNKCVKGDGGAIGLTESASELQRWMVSGPEVARVIEEFESCTRTRSEGMSQNAFLHHDESLGIQKEFTKSVKALTKTIEELGNPFTETSDELLVLDTRDIVHETVATTVKTVVSLGQRQYEEFVEERLQKRNKSVSEPIKSNKLPLFSFRPTKDASKKQQELNSLKENCSLFSRLYISCQARDGDLDNFFSHENQSYPPSLSQHGNLRFGSKSDLMDCLENFISNPEEPKGADVLILDGSAIVNMLKPVGCRTMQDYAENIYLRYLCSQLETVSRLDIVWDVYQENSLKSATRMKRGAGTRRRVESNARVPSNWQGFLRDDKNKTELFKYLAEKTMSLSNEKQVISTKGNSICCTKERIDVKPLAPCEHEEADTRILLHAKDAVINGYPKIIIRTVDTDVVVLAIAMFDTIGAKELWIRFGTGKSYRSIPIHSLCSYIDKQKAKSLPFFHAFTGCDQTSSFAGKGKKTAWAAWQAFDEVTNAFEKVTSAPNLDTLQQVMPVLQRFVIIMYDRSSSCNDVNECRKELFAKKGRSIDAIPPTLDALFQHTKRATLQSIIWNHCLSPVPNLPSPHEWGWSKGPDDKWMPKWITIPQASDACKELLRCGCSPELGCRKRCKCVKTGLVCTALCKCGGGCDQG